MTRPDHRSDKPRVRVKPKTYNPTKAELEEHFIARLPSGAMPTPEEFARIALRPMTVEDDEA